MINTALKKLPRHDRKHRLDLHRRRADGDRGGGAAAGARLGRHALFLGVAADRAAAPRLRRCSRRCLPGDCAARRSRSCRCRSSPIRVVRAGTMASACAVGASLALTIYLPLYFQVVHELSAAVSGLALIPLVVMTTPGSILSGRALSHAEHYKRVPIVALVLCDRGDRRCSRCGRRRRSGWCSSRSPSSAWDAAPPIRSAP